MYGFKKKDNSIKKEFYCAINGDESFIRFVDYDNLCPKAYSQSLRGSNIQNTVFSNLEYLNNRKAEVIAKNDYELNLEKSVQQRGVSCVEYKLTNPRLTKVTSLLSSEQDAGYFFEFDVEIRSEEEFEYQKTEFSMSYSKELFGEYIVKQQEIKVTLSDEFNGYNSSLSDENATKWHILIKKNDNAQAIKVNAFYQKLFSASLFLKTNDLSKLLELKVDETNDLKTFKTKNGVIEQTTCSVFDKNISTPVTNFAAPVITSINTETVTVGTRTLLTINGNNFWPSNVNSQPQVWFTNAYDNQQEWIKPLLGDYKTLPTNTKIEVYVPTNAVDANTGTGGTDRYYAGTGNIKVVSNGVSSNTKPLKVRYAVKNNTYTSKGQPIFLAKHNEKNGYTVGYTLDFKEKADKQGKKFTDAFERALKNWQCKTGLNFIVNPNSTNPDILIGLTAMSNKNNTLAVTSISTLYQDVCDVNIDNKSINHPETFKVDFAQRVITINYNTNYLGIPNSLEAGIAENVERAGVHELGHAHCLLHVNEPTETMFWQGNGTTTITKEAENASNYIIDHSVKHNCSPGKFERFICNTPTNDIVNNFNISVSANSDFISVHNPENLEIQNILIYDIQGRNVIYQKSANNQETVISIPNNIKNNGIYLLTIKSNQGSKTFKFTNLNK